MGGWADGKMDGWMGGQDKYANGERHENTHV